jgi:hypothetical protein
MEERPANRRGRAYLLQPDEKTLELVREFNRRGFNAAECARRLDVHAATYSSFLQRSPEAAQAAEAGKAERRDLLANAIPPGRAELPTLAAPKAGETCPTCGARVGENEDSIVLTPAVLADARRRFDDLIERHAAKRRDDEPDEPFGSAIPGPR